MILEQNEHPASTGARFSKPGVGHPLREYRFIDTLRLPGRRTWGCLKRQRWLPVGRRGRIYSLARHRPRQFWEAKCNPRWPKTAQDGPKLKQDSPSMAARWPQVAFSERKMPQGSAKTSPSWPTAAPRGAKAGQDGPRQAQAGRKARPPRPRRHSHQPGDPPRP